MRDERGMNKMNEVNEVNEIIRLRTTYGVRGLIYGELGSGENSTPKQAYYNI